MQLTEQQKQMGWRIVKFGDVAQEVKANTKEPLSEGVEWYIGLEHINPESLRLTRWGSIEEDKPTFTKKFGAGDILFGRRRAYLKKAAVADFDGICSGDIIVITPKSDDLVPGLLPFIVQSDPFFDWAVKNSAGGLSPRTKFKSLADFEFPLPPRERQEAMLEILENIEQTLFAYDEAIGKGHLFLEKLIKDSVFTENDNDKFVFLYSLVEQVREHFKPDKTSPTISYVGFEHIDSDSIQIKDYGYSSDVHSNKLYFHDGDILYGKIRPYLKKTALADFDGVCSSDIIVLRPTNGDIKDLLSLIIKSNHFSSLAMNTVSGSKMPRANWKALSKVKINKTTLENSEFNTCVKNIVEVIRKTKINKHKSITVKNKVNANFLGETT